MIDKLRASAIRARRAGVTCDDAMRAVAEVFGAVYASGRVDGWRYPEADMPVRRVATERQRTKENSK